MKPKLTWYPQMIELHFFVFHILTLLLWYFFKLQLLLDSLQSYISLCFCIWKHSPHICSIIPPDLVLCALQNSLKDPSGSLINTTWLQSWGKQPGEAQTGVSVQKWHKKSQNDFIGLERRQLWHWNPKSTTFCDFSQIFAFFSIHFKMIYIKNLRQKHLFN